MISFNFEDGSTYIASMELLMDILRSKAY